MADRLREFLLGKPRDIRDPDVFHNISLVAFLAWVGLGADGLSSSAYGPDEAYRALGSHAHLALLLVLMTTVTIFVISIAYSNLIEHFPGGGGGYLVATKLLGERAGVVSGCALLVDYVLTISVSIASACEGSTPSCRRNGRARSLAVIQATGGIMRHRGFLGRRIEMEPLLCAIITIRCAGLLPG